MTESKSKRIDPRVMIEGKRVDTEALARTKLPDGDKWPISEHPSYTVILTPDDLGVPKDQQSKYTPIGVRFVLRQQQMPDGTTKKNWVLHVAHEVKYMQVSESAKKMREARRKRFNSTEVMISALVEKMDMQTEALMELAKSVSSKKNKD